MCRTVPIRGGPIFFRRTCRIECPLKAAFCRDNGEERRQVASGTKEDVFAALTDIENTEKIYLDNGVYKRNTALRSSWDLRIVHEGDQQVSGHGERGGLRSAGGSVRIYSLFQESLRKKRISVHRNGARDTAAVRRNLYDRGIKKSVGNTLFCLRSTGRV